MPKMGFEMLLAELEKSYTWPGTEMRRHVIAAEELKTYILQRKKGVNATHYPIWSLAIGEYGGQLTYFYGHRLLDAAKKAYDWKFPATETPAQGA